MRRLISALGAFSLLLTASVSFGDSAEERAEEATETRQGALKVVRHYFGPVYGMARQQIPYDSAVVAANAQHMAALLSMLPDLFRADTSDEDVDTEALEDIWEDMDDFTAKAEAAAAKARALADAAGDQGAAMSAFRELGGACKACHDDYREQD